MKYIILIIIMLAILPTVAAISPTEGMQSIGTYEQESCINLPQTCANCTFVNISSITFPNSSQALGEVTMTKSGTRYNFTFCNTTTLGDYIVNTFGDEDGIITISNYYFTITPTGFLTEISKVILIAITVTVLLFMILVFGYASILSRKITGLKIFFWALSLIMVVVLLGYMLNVNQNFLAEYVNFNASISSLFILFVILSIAGGLAVIMWLIFSSLRLLSKTRGTYTGSIGEI